MLDRCRGALALTAALFLLLLAPNAPTQAQSPSSAPQPGAITGRVTTDDGKAAPRVGVALMPAEYQPNRNRPVSRAETDGDGRFRMTNVPAGRYRLLTLTPAHTAPDLRGSFLDNGRLINVAAGETVEGADFVLTRGGVITGRVTTGDGKPAVGERIGVTYADRRNERGPAASAVNPFEWETDDRGVYRIYGLAPGRYLVSVGQDTGGGVIVVGMASPRYARTFHPSTTDAAQARVVEVSSGMEATGVDISLADAPKSFQATGRIVDEAGRPVAGVGVAHSSLRPDQKSIGGWGWDGSKSNQNGEFVLKNLFPGRYAAFIVKFGGDASPAHNDYSEPAQFEITDGDISNLTIRMKRGGSISGTAVVEGTNDRAVIQRLSTLSIYANLTPAKPDQLGAAVMGDNKINPDGSFRIAGIAPGKMRLVVGGFPQPKGFTLLRVERNGVEVPRDGIEVGPGEQVTGVRLVIGYGTATLRGQISLVSNGQPAALPEGVRLSVSAARAGAGASAANFGGGATVDARGRFVLEGLMSGEYELTVRAFAPGAPGAQQYPAVKQTVQMTEGGEASVTVVYDLSKTTETKQ
ncbi:MAG TPA: hypothetical protein VK421_10000 [Pyrinomonadaceae bacterium]|nr:hypothetical protein [Pyrinomonadaceae bacterium]